MPPFRTAESATLPRGFRFHYQDGDRPRTPEPLSAEEIRQPSPPRQPRLKVRRRNGSQMSGPTEQFLASVAAADIPLPTIEVPDHDEIMMDRSTTPLPLAGFLAPQTRSSPPKTPAPQTDSIVCNGISRRRDWYLDEHTPDDSPTRPSSSLSNPSNWSDDSYFGSRFSRPSEDGSCTSPDSDIADPFSAYSSFSKGKGKNAMESFEVLEVLEPLDVLNGHMRSKTRKDAQWSREMSDHLWQIYQVYLQDPTVTPFRIGASAVPPEGVIHRVAREAKRSWKGAKTTRQQERHIASLAVDADRIGSPETTTSRSGSLTPTGGGSTPKVYLRWPHSSAATRNRLREMCKRKDTTSVQRHRHLQSKSPTPFTKNRLDPRSRLRTPDSGPQPFSTSDFALSLATSTANSMQSDGPLAKLADESQIQPKFPFKENHVLGLGISMEPQSRRLGSPFSARTYGPSSSNILSASLRPEPPRAHSDNVRESQLRSPVHFDQTKSLNGTMKRRAQHSLDEELSPNGGVLRPTILDDLLFRDPGEAGPQRRVRSRGFTLGDEALNGRMPGLFMPRESSSSEATPTIAASAFVVGNGTPFTPAAVTANHPLMPSVFLDAPANAPPRLRSPFSESGANQTFPRRLFGPSDDTLMPTVGRRAFATIHHSRRSIESFEFEGGEGPSLQTKLNNLDQRLAEIRERDRQAHQ